MVRIEQIQDNLYSISVSTPDNSVKFSGTFQRVETPADITPEENGMKLEIKFPGEE